MKKNKKNLYYTISIAILFCIIATPIYNSKIYIGHDSLFHYQRIEQLALSLKNGVLYPTIQSGALSGQGYGVSLFYPDIFLLLPAFFVNIGISKFDSLSMFIFLLNIVTFYIAYYTLKTYLKDLDKNFSENNYVLLLGAVSYVVSPYRLYNIIIRCAVSELIAMTFIPIIVLSLYKVFIKRNYKYWKLLSVGFSLILLSHLSSTLIMGFVGVIFLLFNISLLKDKKFYKAMLKAIFVALLLTSYFLFPMIEQMLNGSYLYNLRPTIKDSVLNPFETIDAMSIQIIPIKLNEYIKLAINALYIITSIFTIKKLKKKKDVDYKIICLVGSVFILLYIVIVSSNLFPWKIVKDILSVVQQIQFPFRFYMLSCIPISMCLIFGWMPENENKLRYASKLILLGLSTVMMINLCGLREDNSLEIDYINNHELVKGGWNLGMGEFIPASMNNLEFTEGLKKDIDDNEIITSTVLVNNTKHKITSKKQYNKIQINLNNIKSNESYELTTELIYYKGYRAFIDNKELDVDKNEIGRIKISNIPKDSKELVIFYERTSTQKISIYITAISLCVLAVSTIIRKENYIERVV